MSKKVNRKMALNDDKYFDSAMAWSKLYARLEADNLLVAESEKRVGFRGGAFLKVAAMVAFMVVLVGVAIFFTRNEKVFNFSNVAVNSTKIIQLPDQTVVYLAQNSSLEYSSSFNKETRSVKLQGEAFFDVAKNPDKPFVISTAKAVVRVLGTSFNLKAENNSEVELDVVDGKVRIELVEIPENNLIAVAGENVISENNELLKVEAETFSQKSKIVKMQFQDQTMQSIVQIVNKLYGSNIQLEGVDLQNRVISVMFENDFNSIVSILSESFGLQKKTTIDGDILLISK